MCWLALVCAVICASAQSVPPGDGASPKLIPRTKAEREAQYAFHHRILLNVQVIDSAGHPVIGLDARSFTILIDHQPQAITSFRSIQDGGTTAHARAFFVIDMLNNTVRDLATTRKAIKGLVGLDKLLPLPTSLLELTDTGAEVSRPSQQAAEIAAELDRVTRNFRPRDCTEDWNNAALGKAIAITSLDDVDRGKNRDQSASRISSCLNHKYQRSFTALLEFAHQQQDVPGRAILIWIGPGWPNLSGPEFAAATPNVRESFFANLVNASTELREGQVTLEAVSWPASSPIAKLNYSDLDTLMRGTPTSAQASAGSVALPVLAHMSGGQVYTTERNLTAELAACLADANSYYLLGFDSTPSALPDEYRSIEVTVAKPGVTVRTNTSYYAQP